MLIALTPTPRILTRGGDDGLEEGTCIRAGILKGESRTQARGFRFEPVLRFPLPPARPPGANQFSYRNPSTLTAPLQTSKPKFVRRRCTFLLANWQIKLDFFAPLRFIASMDHSTKPARQEAAKSGANLKPLCVDMDGTLLISDTMEELIVSFLRAHFWRCGTLLFWLLRGRAYFKRRLAEEAVLQVDLLPVDADFIKFLEGEHTAGRTLVLASAADERTVKLVAERFKFFSMSIGSDGKTNLKSEAKLGRLVELFGPKGFDYAGNSSADIPVWRGAAEAIVVNASQLVERRAREAATVVRVFPRQTGCLFSFLYMPLI